MNPHPALIFCLPLVIGFLLDFLLGDPSWLPHPVRLIGWAVSKGEGFARRLSGKSRRGELAAGTALTAACCVLFPLLALALLWLAERWSPWLRIALASWICYTFLAARDLSKESKKVEKALKTGDLEKARQAVSMIVGRDTGELDGEGVARAAVETVAENTSDGVIAPLFYMALGGPALMTLYKTVNTLDSMIGYKNDKYRYFGRVAARLDDVLNWIPARLSARLMLLGGVLMGHDGREGIRIYRRDRRKHASPNSAHTEAACAGLLGLRLAGPARYFGKLVDKPYIGDSGRQIRPEDITAANRLMFTTSFLALLLFTAARLLLYFAM